MVRLQTPNGCGLTLEGAYAWMWGLLLVAGCAMVAYDGVVIMICYTKVEARIDRVAMLCQPSGKPIEEAVECESLHRPQAGATIESPAAYVKYTSPADGREYRERVVADSKRQRMQILRLRPGDSLMILAKDSDPHAIRMLN